MDGGASAAGDDAASRRASARHPKRKKIDDDFVQIVQKKKRDLSSPIPGKSHSKQAPAGKAAAATLSSAKGKGKGGKGASSTKAAGKYSKEQAQHADDASEGSSSSSSKAPPHCWPPLDDFKLIYAVQQVNDLASIFKSVRFSRGYSLKQIQRRWYALLYDERTARLASAAIASLDADTKRRAMAHALWSPAEEKALRTFAKGLLPKDVPFPPPSSSTAASSSSSSASSSAHQAASAAAAKAATAAFEAASCTLVTTLQLRDFEELLMRERASFLPSRRAADLKAHFELMVAENMLNPHAPPPAPKLEEEYEFEEVLEDLVVANVTPETTEKDDSGALRAPETSAMTPHLEKELTKIDQKCKRKIRRLEYQLQSWRADDYGWGGASEAVKFTPNTLGFLAGQTVRYPIMTKEVHLGRNAPGNVVDVDLSEEGSSAKISRRQCIIKLKHDGYFYAINQGKRTMYVNGEPVGPGARERLGNNSVLEVADVRLLFTLNDDLFGQIHAELGKQKEGVV